MKSGSAQRVNHIGRRSIWGGLAAEGSSQAMHPGPRVCLLATQDWGWVSLLGGNMNCEV